MPIAKSAHVRQIVPVIQGEVADRRFNDQADELEYLVTYTDGDGNPSSRWFLEAQLAEVSQ